jgi:hypothetical protein
VTAAQRRQAVTAVIFRIIVIADPDQRRFEQIFVPLALRRPDFIGLIFTH